MTDSQENIKLSFDENQTTGYYVRIRFDILNDVFVYDCIIKFDNKSTALAFKNSYDNHYISKKSYLVKSSDNIWLKQYHNKFLEIYDNDKAKKCNSFTHKSLLAEVLSISYGVPHLSTQSENINEILDVLTNYWNEMSFESHRFVYNNYITILSQSIETTDDENELHLFRVINNDANQSHRTKIEKQEYEQLKLSTKRIDCTTRVCELKDGEYFLASDIDEIIFQTEFSNIQDKYEIIEICKMTIYDIASEMHSTLYYAFFLNPLEFTKTEEAKKWFDSETLGLMDFDIKKTIDQLKLTNQSGNISNKEIASLYNTYISKRYVNYVKELEQLELEQSQQLEKSIQSTQLNNPNN